MKKLQQLHDYLLASGLVTSESMDTWVTEGGMFGDNDARETSQSIELRYQVNISLDDYPFTTQDIRKVLFALKWWLDVYEPDPIFDKERVAMAVDIKTSTTAYFWFGFTVTELSWLEASEVHSCTEPWLEDDCLAETDFLTYLKNARTGETRLINGSVSTD